MDETIKERWVEALRSGEYEQATDRLYDPATNGYCCLGVLCDLLPEFTYDSAQLAFRDADGHRVSACAGRGPGRKSPGGVLRGDRLRLARMNDRGKSFTEIANYIEENL